jgi:hypothetical protein
MIQSNLVYFLVLLIPRYSVAWTESMFDFLRPLRYTIEKRVAGQSIPSVADIPNRIKLSDTTIIQDDIGESFDHTLWTNVLSKHVYVDATFGAVTGAHAVDYAGVAADRDYDAYLQQLAAAQPALLSKRQQLAFWMNAYNALCVNLIVQYERTATTLKSINELSASGVSVWDKPAGVIDGVCRSLNYIEHDMLRKVWDEPAIHGCIVCASASCPNLRPEAYCGDKLEEQMSSQMTEWMKNPTKGCLAINDTLILSRIFLWFQDDFQSVGGVTKWLSNFCVMPTLKRRRYFDYSWEINRYTK